MFCLKDYEEYAKKYLDSKSWAFYSQGAERELTLRENIRSFTRYHLIPRMLRNVQERDLSVTILGDKVSMPIGIAPTAYQKLAHPEGEIAASKAASEAGVVYTLSTVATTALEDVANNLPQNTPLWMQVYLLNDRSRNLDMIRKAEAHGYRALVLTVDTPVIGLQLKERRNTFELPPHLSTPNILPLSKSATSNNPNKIFKSGQITDLFDTAITWEEVSWLTTVSRLPVILKGILTAEDALLAVKHGASAVWVSNHGGRQLDGVKTALDALPDIVTALVGSECEIYMDGGIRWGTDILKALALGAKAVFIGRPALWGLCHSGQEGVRTVLQILRDELDKAMHLSGCKDISDIGPHLVQKRSFSKL